ncbi:two component transcriptional regulator, LytTR family [Filimonas lacunae]|uniref:Two component transcriptional regulator, LytTR family n=1 Tax=Filimonas lacunae TaxID=477680 RepID=A0A173MEC3_9BACT|nr:LytTR family DNA-binding domain-containing protein [Filimonas lacunae]BAV05846.1 response regulator [Filimonas lacunae]SIT28392.1 two component transcriptional regulator, LytTR family [Filimonas lacunae]
MIRTLIIDDEPAIRRDTSRLMENREGFFVTGTCGTLSEARVLIANTEPDLLLLDIELSDGNGFDLLEAFPARTFRVIFITAYNHYAIKAIKYGAFDYLLKPLEEEELAAALQRVQEYPLIQMQQQVVAREHLKPALHNRIVLRSQQYLQVVSFEEIWYCQGEGSYTTFYLSDNRKVTVSRPMKEYEDLLPESWFIRTHQSYMVNHYCIERLHKDGYIILRNGTEIPVSTRKKEYVMQFLTGQLRRSS